MTGAFSLKLEVCSRVPRTGMEETVQADTRRILKGSFVLCVGEPPEKAVTCGSHPLESSFQKVLRCGYVSTELYEYKRLGAAPEELLIIIAAANTSAEVALRLVRPWKYELRGDSNHKVATAYACRMVEHVVSHPLTQFVIDGENNLWLGNPISSYSKKRCLKENYDIGGLGECAGKELLQPYLGLYEKHGTAMRKRLIKFQPEDEFPIKNLTIQKILRDLGGRMENLLEVQKETDIPDEDSEEEKAISSSRRLISQRRLIDSAYSFDF
ncbi:hypothetical protein Tco_0295848 [Tanacetum coccineum]